MDTLSQEIEEMRRQVLEMEQDLARENEAASIAALTGASSLSATDGVAKKSGDGPDDQPGDSNDPSAGLDPSGAAEIITGEDPDGRSIYVGNVCRSVLFCPHLPLTYYGG